MINSRLVFYFSLLIILALPGQSVAAGDAGGGKSNLEVALIVKGKKKSDTWINISGRGSLIEIPGAPVLFALKPLLSASILSRVESQLDADGLLTNRILARYGVGMSYNAALSQLTLTLPDERPVKVTPPPPVAKDTTPPPARAKSPDASGPWTTSPVPALPGQKDTGGSNPNSVSDGADSAFAPDVNVAADSVKKNTIPVVVAPKPPTPARASKAEVKLQNYQFDQTRDEMFEDVFKHKAPPAPIRVEVTLMVDGKAIGTVWINNDKERKQYTFPTEPILNALQGSVKQELWDNLARRAVEQPWFTSEDLIQSGFPTVLNTSTFELSISIPAQLLGTKIHPMSGQPVDPYTVPARKPAGFSAYVNTRVKERVPYFQYNPNPYDTNGFGKRQVKSRNNHLRDPIITNFEGAVNVKSWVVEGKTILWEKPDRSTVELSRQEFRLVHDWPRRALRLSVGDLIFPTTGFQSFLNMGGIGLSRDFSLQPHLVAYPVKEFEFFLSNPSEVKVYINGVLRGVYQLDQGSHNLQGFPFTAGESSVEIQITDNTGQMQTLKFNFIHEPSMLANGKSSFSYNMGFPSHNVYITKPTYIEPESEVLWNYQYDLAHPTLFVDYRVGLTNYLNVESYSQAMDTAGMVGFDVVQAMKIGKIKVELAGSYHQDYDPSWAGNLEYTYIPKITSNLSPISWRVRTEYLGETFYRLGQDQAMLGSLTFAGYVQKNAQIANVNLGTSYSLRPDSADYYTASASMSHNWPKGWSLSLNFNNTFTRGRSTGTSVAAMLSYYFGRDRQALNASQRIENHRPDITDKGNPPAWDYSTDIAWDYNGSAPFPANPAVNVATTFGPISNDYTGKAEWKSNQGTAQIVGRRYEPKTNSVITNYADMTLQTSLVFVDWNFALSRPIPNSFVMVKGIENEKKCEIIANPSGDNAYDAKSARWRPGVIPNVNPYYLKKVHVEVLDPPFGSNDDKTEFTIYPTYKSGYVLYMGTKATVIALGTFQLAPGVPAEYQTFKATPMEGKVVEPIYGFTNGAGKFQLIRVKPGKYMIEMEVEGKPYSTILELPKNAEGIKSVGTMILSPH